MNDPERLLNAGASDDELALLRAGVAEEPSADGLARVAAALGLGAIALPPATLTPPSPVAPPQDLSLLEVVRAKLGMKWLALAGSGLALGGAVTFTSLRATAPTPRAARAPSSVVASAVPSTTDAAVADLVAPVTEVRVLEEPAHAPPERRPHARSRTVTEELERLDRVRAHLRTAGIPTSTPSRAQQREAKAALVLLAAYERAHRGGELREEARLLRIEALAQAGQHARARREAHTFVQLHPESVHVERLRAWLEEDAR